MFSFVSGKILLISTGYYSDSLEKLLPNNCSLTICKYEDIGNIKDSFDWVLCAYTETSVAFKVDLQNIKDKSEELGARLFVASFDSL